MTRPRQTTSQKPMDLKHDAELENLDVLIVGAGLSGIGLAYYLQRDCPNKHYAIVESRQASGGTWDLFRYPGIRSDSDLFTFGYEFKPWKDEKAIADAASILKYIRETASENDIDQKIRYSKKVISANWQSDISMWLVELQDTKSQETQYLQCRWLFSAAGYYNYAQGYSPEFIDQDKFQGQIIHPQHWPEQLDYQNKRVLIIGSGATAVTLVPAMAEQAAHVVMLQRTPTYIMNLPSKDPIANLLRKTLPEDKAHQLIRNKNIHLSRVTWRFCQKYPNLARKIIRKGNKSLLPQDYPIDTHFQPPYNPWDQRLCVVPDGDLFNAISSGKASMVTDRIQRFTEHGVLLESGHELKTDIIITATGLNVQLFGGMKFKENDQDIQLSKTVAFKGMMLSDIPNFAFALGYTNASWTLKVSLLCEHFCRLLNEMDQQNVQECRAELPSADMPTRPLLDFGAGYVQRVMQHLPKQGLQRPWLMSMDYLEDVDVLRKGPVRDPYLKFKKQNPPTEIETSTALDFPLRKEA